MIIYSDQISNKFGHAMTPAQTHVQITDFSQILDDLAKGLIPCGTNQPFPVDWKTDDDDEVTSPNDVPWFNNTDYRAGYNTSFYNPFEQK